jgi:hypothetical protein
MGSDSWVVCQKPAVMAQKQASSQTMGSSSPATAHRWMAFLAFMQEKSFYLINGKISHL